MLCPFLYLKPEIASDEYFYMRRVFLTLSISQSIFSTQFERFCFAFNRDCTGLLVVERIKKQLQFFWLLL